MELKSIPMEAETIPMLVGGFTIVLAMTVIFIFALWFRYKKLSYFWFVGQVLFLICGFFYVLKVLDDRVVTNSMVSEDTSLYIGFSAVFWALSMICMIIGIWQLSKGRDK